MRLPIAAALLGLFAGPAFGQQIIASGIGSGGFVSPTDAVWINTPGPMVVGTPATITGGYSGLAPVNIVLADTGAAGANCSATIGAGTWSCSFTPGTGGNRYLAATNTGDTRAATTDTFVVSGGAYSGPGDVAASATFFGGVRGYSAAYSTGSNSAMTIRRASDNTTSVINILSSGILDTATAGTFCTATTCFVRVLTDQSGHGNDLTQTTDALQPQLIFNCVNTTVPCMRFSSTQYLTGADPGISTPVTLYAVGSRTGAFTSFGVVLDLSSFLTIYWTNSANHVVFQSGDAADLITATTSDNAWHNFIGATPSSGTGTFYVDGTSATATLVSETSSTLTLSRSSNGMTADIGELGVWPSQLNGTVAGNLCNNSRLYYGSGGSC